MRRQPVTLRSGSADQRSRAAAPRRGPRRRALVTLLVCAAAVLVAQFAAPGPAAAIDSRGEDWDHVQRVLATLETHPPKGPMVYLLGGSTARECTVTDANWRAEIARLGVSGVRAYNFGSASQSYEQGIWVVERAPDVPTLVLIGVNVGRYTPPYKEDEAIEPARAAKGTYDQHRFHSGGLPDAAKWPLVGKWMRERYPVFKKRYTHHAAVLPQLVKACQDRGFFPVIVELPLNLPIVRHSWDAPRAKYRAGCRAVAKKYDVPYVDLVAATHLVSADFYDLSHLVSPGRVKWQHKLSHLIVRRLHQYHADSSASRKESAPDNG